MQYHDNMEKQIRFAFPLFNDKQVRKATYNAQYATHGSIWVGRTEVFIEIQVD